MITNWDEKSYRHGKCHIGIASKYSKIKCFLSHLPLRHTAGYPNKMLIRTVTYTGNQKSSEGRNKITCDFSSPTICYTRIQELNVQAKNHISHRKTSSQHAGLKGGDTIEATVKPKTNSLCPCLLQMESGRFLSRQLSFTGEEQGSFSIQTELLSGEYQTITL